MSEAYGDQARFEMNRSHHLAVIAAQEHDLGFDMQQAGNIVLVNDQKYTLTTIDREIVDAATRERVTRPYTYREYYSHHDPVTEEPGPGWNALMILTDPDTAMRLHGRTFAIQQIVTPHVYMPDTPLFRLQPVYETLID